MMMKPTIYLCDDEEGVRGGLSFLLKQYDLMVSAHASGAELLSTIDALGQPVRGVFVLDVRMEPMSGPQVHEQLIARGLAKRNPVIFLSGHGDIPVAVAAMARGALNFVEKPYTDGTLIPILQDALVLEEKWHGDAVRSDFLASMWQSLTPQQRRVGLLVAEGNLNKVIAGKLNITDRMVEVHRSKAFEKLGVDSAAELATTIAAMKVYGLETPVEPGAAKP